MVTMEEEASVEPQATTKNKRPTLDAFWHLRNAKNDKNRLEAAGRVLSSLATSAIQPDYALGRLVRGLAAADHNTRQGFFICLTEFLRQSDTKYADVAKVAEASLKAVSTNSGSKSEEADFLLGRLLVLSSVLRAGILPAEERGGVVGELLEVSKARRYLLLPVYRLLVEHFVPEGGQVLLTLLDSIDLAKLDMETAFLLLHLLERDAALVGPKVIESLGVKKVFGKKVVEKLARVLATANAPPSVVARHPLLPLLVSSLASAGAIQKFWAALSADMTVANNSGVVGWTFLLEVSKHSPAELPGLLTRHALSVGLQLASKQASVALTKEVMAGLVAAVEADKADRLAVIKQLVGQDVAWDKTVLGGQVQDLLAKADSCAVQEVGGLFLTCLEAEGKVAERVHSGSQLVRIVGHPAVQGELEWRGRVLQGLASVSLLQGVEGVAKLTRLGVEGLRDTLGRGLDTRNRSLEDNVSVTLTIVSWIRGQLEKPGVSLLKAVTPEQEEVAGSTMLVIRDLEKRWGKTKNKEVGVFLHLHCHMWLQCFLQPELAREVLEELGPVYSRWCGRKGAGEEPEWVEVGGGAAVLAYHDDLSHANTEGDMGLECVHPISSLF